MENFTNLGMTEIVIVAIMALLLIGLIWLGVRIIKNIRKRHANTPYIILLVLSISLFACGSNRQAVSSASIPEEEIYLVPDSLLTQEQLEMKKEYIQKIQAVVMEYVKVIDSSRTEFIMKKQDFLKTGLPKSIYKKIKKEMRINNRFLKENDIKNLETSW